MKALILNASPKKKGGASRYFGKLLKAALLGCDVTSVDVRSENDYQKAISLLQDIDVLVISAPLYNDAIPSHFVPFLSEVEQLNKEKNMHFKVYTISNSGFVEGIQNKTHLKMYEAWCKRANLCFCGGLGIGGGVMLHVLSVLLPILIILALIEVGITVVQTGSISFFDFLCINRSALVTLFFGAGAYIEIFRLSRTIRGGKRMSNRYTRVLLPSFLFLIVADVFMALSYAAQLPRRIRLYFKKC